MLIVKFLFICVYMARRRWSIEVKLTGTFDKISKLPSIHPDYVRVSQTTDGLHPADLLAIVRDVNNRFDCLLLCKKHTHCMSTNYIPKGKFCLLSKSAMKVSKRMEWNKEPSPIVSYYSGLLYADELFGTLSPKPTLLGHGKPPAICGMNFANDQVFSNGRRKRIVDGWTPEPYTAPWVGLLLRDNKVRCTAFIVPKGATDKSSVWVLSAKHCFLDPMTEDDEDDKIDLKPFALMFGIHDLRFFTQQILYRKIAAVKLYPDEGIKPKDFALIRLSKPVRFNSYINGLCLSEQREMAELFDGAMCQTCGFGATRTSQEPAVGSSVLQCIDVAIQDSDYDHSLFSDWNSVVKFRSPGFGPYHGDSGSPIFCSTGDPWSFLFALVTDGRSSGLRNSYLTAARISYFMAFITDNMSAFKVWPVKHMLGQVEHLKLLGVIFHYGLDLKPFSLLFGVHDLRVRTQRSILRTANEIFFPPDEGLKPKDIALIKLNKAVKFTGYINGLCLPDVMEEYQLSDETPCMTCGFGATDENAKPAVGSGVLQCIEVEAQESDLDHNLFGDWNSVVKLKAAAFGPFHGDSGSPIFCSSGSLWSFLFAIVTGGQRSVFKNAYMSAARIAYYMNFIEGKMRDDTCCAAS